MRRGQAAGWLAAMRRRPSAVEFDSGTLDPGGVYALEPGAPGKITYYCTVHGKAQSGTITVTR